MLEAEGGEKGSEAGQGARNASDLWRLEKAVQQKGRASIDAREHICIGLGHPVCGHP